MLSPNSSSTLIRLNAGFQSKLSGILGISKVRLRKVQNLKSVANSVLKSESALYKRNDLVPEIRTLLFSDGGASTSMFCSKNEVKNGTYTEDDHESITLAAGGKTVKCAGEGTIEIGSVDLPN